MIENERQYKVTKAQIAKFEAALQQSQKSAQKLPLELREAVVAGIQSQIDDLRAELQEYEALKAKKVDRLPLESLARLGDILIKARIARGYTQAELAERLNLKPQQIQKYEATRYESASFHRLLDVMFALEIDVQAEVDLAVPEKPDAQDAAASERKCAPDKRRISTSRWTSDTPFL